MVESKGIRPELALVLARFPQDSAVIRRAFLADQNFRDACEDYSTARETYQRFFNTPASRDAPEVVDYASVIAGLEAEIEDMIQHAKKRHRL